MKKISYIIIGILVLIIIALVLIIIFNPREKHIIKYKKCVIQNDEEKFDKVSYDLKDLRFNSLKINDSSKGADLLLDSNYSVKDNIYIKDKDDKIYDLYTSLSNDNTITYNNKKLTTLEDFIATFGQYDQKVTYYNEDDYDFIYSQVDNKSSDNAEYSLTIKYNKEKGIRTVELVRNEIYIMG